MNRTLKRLALPIGVAAVLGTTGFAFMSSNAFQSTPGAGDSAVAASGYTITNISHTACNVNNEICYFHFDAQAIQANENQPSSASVSFDGGKWYQCTAAANYSGARPFTCDLRNANGTTSNVTSAYGQVDVSVIG